MKNISKLLFICIAALFISCDTDEILPPANQVSLERDKDVTISIGTTISDQIGVYTGAPVGQDRTYNIILSDVSIPNSSLDIPSTVVIPAGSNEGTIDFSVVYNDEFTLSGGSFTVSLENTAENLIGNQELTVGVNVTCDSPASIDFVFDGFASETTWTITDDQGNVVYSGGGYEDGQASFSREVCLNDGVYEFTVNDSFGDGLSFPNIGSASISFQGEVLTEAVGDFGSQFVGQFTIQN